MSQTSPLIKCLSECDKCTEVTVVKVEAGLSAKRRLANLGIIPGTIIVKTKSAPFQGPVEVSVKGTSLVLGRGLASKIIVKCGDYCTLPS